MQGPAGPGRSSLLRGLQHPGDNDANHDGIPDFVGRPGADGLYWTAIAAEGVNRPAGGATYTASGGFAQTDFEGAFDGLSAIRGTYGLALGGLDSERSVWRQTTLTLLLESAPGVGDKKYTIRPVI